MLINFDHLYDKGLNDTQLLVLLKAAQKLVDLIDENDPNTTELEEAGFINKGSLTAKGKRLMLQLTNYRFTDEVAELAKELNGIYEAYGAGDDNEMEIMSRLSWFLSSTGFTPEAVKSSVENYLNSCGKYRLSLRNLIWNPPSKAFSVHYNLKDSRLFSQICKDYDIKPHVLVEGMKKNNYKWLKAMSSTSIPIQSTYWTGSRKTDIEKQKEFRKEFSKLIREK